MAAHLHLKVFILSGQRDGPPAAECNEALFYLFCQSNALLFNAAAIEVAKVASKHLFHAIQQPFYPTFNAFPEPLPPRPGRSGRLSHSHKKEKNVILSLLPPNGYFLLLAAWMVFHPNNCERGIFVCLTDFIPHPAIEPLDIDSSVLRPSKHTIML
ncbi:hypothetical protein DdX_16121 [Ditylenchus destructor]|uniref:Uncharacterized protein n=1 Tax=Ditylenchus destructor TaxID=166010 RepID=A0AAD4MRI2_9BILA|nr:hypothetical protein DdX_16121 [Ditylenchus destructor]